MRQARADEERVDLGGHAYAVSFHRTVVAVVAQGSSFALLCHLLGVNPTTLSDRRVAGTTAGTTAT